MATTIVGHDSEPLLREEEHLAVPHVRVQGPSVREGDDRALAPVLVVDRRTVFRRNRAHVHSSYRVCIGSVSVAS